MRLTVLGCRAGMPGDGQPSSGYLVDSGGTRVLLDCGPGIATALSAAGGGRSLSAVVISHLHLDHCYDLLPLGKALLFEHAPYPRGDGPPPEPDYPEPPIPLYVPEGGRELLTRLAALFPVASVPMLDKAFELALDVREYRPGDTVDLDGARLTLHELRHALPNCGTRIETERLTFAFTGDTGATDALNDLADGCDVLLSEASLTYTDAGSHGHLSAADAGRVAAAAGVGELVLTHFPSSEPVWLEDQRDAASREYDGPVHVAAPGRRFDFTS